MAELDLAAASTLLYREARLLDERAYTEWLSLFTSDVRYWAPANETRYSADLPLDMGPRMAFFDDGHAQLAMRVRRFEADSAWAEDPPTRHVHLVSNIEIVDDSVASVVVAYRSRGDAEMAPIVARRMDRIRLEGDALRISYRRVDMVSTLLHARNINTFL